MKKVAIKAAQVLLWVVYVWVAVTLVLLLLAFILELFGANPTAGFVQWVYRSTERAMAPFRGIFEPIKLSNQSVLDVSVLFAMIVYTFVALGLHLAIDWVTRSLRDEERRERQLEVLNAQQAAVAPRRVLQLADPTGVAATVVLTPQAYGTSIELTASGLEPLQSYRAWLEGPDGARVSTTAFQADASGVGRLAVTTPAALAATQAFGLTRVPAAGDTGGRDILSAPLV